MMKKNLIGIWIMLFILVSSISYASLEAGTKMFIVGNNGQDVNEYTCTTGFDVSTCTYDSVFSVSAQTTSPIGISFNTDGTKMFIVGASEEDVNEYTCTTGFDVSTCIYDSVFSVSAQETAPYGISFNTDGTKMFIVGASGEDVNEYTCTTGFDVSTCTYDSVFDVSAQETIPTGISFNTDGTKMFIVGPSGDAVNEYTCTTGFDVSTCTYDSVFSVSAQETAPYGISFNTDGTKMFIVGPQGDDVNEYTCTTGFDVSTCTYDSVFDVSAQDTAPMGIYFNTEVPIKITANDGSLGNPISFSSVIDILGNKYHYLSDETGFIINESYDNVGLDSYGTNDGTLTGYVFNNGTVSGGVTIEDGAMVFDGVDGYVATIPSSDLPKEEITISGWFKTDSLGSVQPIFGDYGSTGNRGILFYIRNTNELRTILFNTADDAVILTTGISVEVDTLYHMSVTYKSGEAKIFVNGEQKGTTQTSLTGDLKTTSLTARMGNNGGTNNFWFDGSISPVQIFNRALSSTEITEIYEAGKDSYSPVGNGLVGQWGSKDFEGPASAPTSILDMNHISQRTDNTTALNFDGVNDVVTLPSDFLPFANLDRQTISLWFNVPSKFLPGVQILFSSAGASNNRVYVQKLNNGVIQTRIGTTSLTFASATDYNENEWNHVSFIRDAENNKTTTWFNGNKVVDNQDIIIGTGTTEAQIHISSIFGTQNFFKGSIDDVRIFNRSLNSTEIADLYNNRLNTTVGIDNLVSHFPLQAPIYSKLVQQNNAADISIYKDNYYSYEETDADFSAGILGSLYQSEVSFETDSIVTGSNLANANVTINGITKDISEKWYLSGSETFTATFSKADWYNQSVNFTITPLTSTLVTFEDVYDAKTTFSLNQSLYDLGTYKINIANSLYGFSETTGFLTSDPTINLESGTLTINILNGSTIIYSEVIVIGAGETTEDLSHVGFNELSVLDVSTSLPINDSLITITYPNGDIITRTTNSSGSITFPSFTSLTTPIGNYTFIVGDVQGYVTPITFTKLVTKEELPFNVSYNISLATLSILLRDGITNNLITDNITVSIDGVGNFNTGNGTLFFQDIALVSGEYRIFTNAINYTFAERTFTFTNQETLEITLILYNKETANVGSVFVRVYDSFLDIVSGADVRLQEYIPAESSYKEVGQSITNSAGQSVFQILLEGKSYRFLVTKTIDGATYQEFSSEEGNVFYFDGEVVNVYLKTVIDYSEDYIDGLSVTVTNTNLTNNISTHQVNFIDNLGLDHTVCLSYTLISKLARTQLVEKCETGASGTVNYDNGYNLTSSLAIGNVLVEVYKLANGQKINYYRQVYTNKQSFEELFGDLIAFLILVTFIGGLALSLHLKRIDYFVYLEIFISFIWGFITPSWMSLGLVSVNLVMGLMVLFLAQKSTSAEEN